MREIALDTETTGLSVEDGHRVIQIGAVELIDLVKTGNNFFIQINPERKSDKEAKAVHGIEDDDLMGEPTFSEICNDFLSYIKDSRLIIHNAPFDLSFLNNEFKLAGYNIEIEKKRVIDTMELAIEKEIYANRNLQSLISRFEKHDTFEFDKSSRDIKKKGVFHGALKDADALAEVYIQLKGGKQTALNFNDAVSNVSEENTSIKIENNQKNNTHLLKKRLFEASKEEKEKHKDFVKKIKNPIWNKYF